MKNNHVFQYTITYPEVSKRKEECDKILKEYPERIPIICEKDPKCTNIQEIDKTKFLVSNDLTVAQFHFMIRKKLNLIDEQSSFYLLVNGDYAINGDIPLVDIYQKHKNPEDGFLYILYTSTLVWGNDNKKRIYNN